MRHPDQPQEWDDEGVLRFKKNPLVRRMADRYGLNELAVDVRTATDDDWRQLAQLIGYSVSGWGSLSYVTDEDWNRVVRESDVEPKPLAAELL